LQSGPLGIKAIVSWLNGRAYRYRGKPFHTSNIDALLHRTTYAGTAWFNRRCARTGALRPREEWIAVPVPAIIDPAMFEALQARLAARNPRRMPPRLVNGPTLLTGLARCRCGGALSLRTGKSGRYRYYACARRAGQGETACPGQSIRMERLDDQVLDALERRLFLPSRLTALLQACLARARDASDRQQTLTRLKTERTHVEVAIHRLYELVEQGLAAAGDAGFAARLTSQRARLAMLEEEITQAVIALAATDRRISPLIVAHFGALLQQRLRGPTPQLRQGYVRLLLSRVALDAGAIALTASAAVLAPSSSPSP
jgi:hypothetical protein